MSSYIQIFKKFWRGIIKLGKFEVCYIASTPSRYQKRHCTNYSKFLKSASAILGIAITNVKTYASTLNTGDALDKLDVAGNEVLHIGQRIGYWVCIIMAIFEIIKAVKDGDTNAFWGIIVKYGLAFGSLFMLPWVFDLIAGIFS